MPIAPSPTRVQLPAASRPLYRSVKTWLLAQLASGRWKPGALLPSQAELCAALGVSVGTLRQAVGELEDEDVLVRRQGSGTYVKSFGQQQNREGDWNRFQRFQGGDGRLLSIRSEPVLFEHIQPTPEIAAALNIPAGEAVIHIRRRLYERGPNRFICLDDSYLIAAFFSRMTEQSLLDIRGSLYRYYENDLGVTIVDCRDILEAVTVTRQLSRETGFPFGTPMFKLTRTANTFGRRIVEYRIERVTGVDCRVALS